VLLISLAIAGVFLLPYCNLLFKCGCKFPWQGGVDFCNIHQAGVPHCPWCVARNPVLETIPVLLVLSGQAFSIFYFDKKYRWSFMKLLFVSLIIFYLLSAVHGFFFKLLDNYPHFLFY